MDGVVPFANPFVCGYKRWAMSFGLKFYWTDALYWPNIEVAKVFASPNRGANHPRHEAQPISGQSAQYLNEEAS
jgi:hypothetical protein